MSAKVVWTTIFTLGVFKCIAEVDCVLRCYQCLAAPPIYYTNKSFGLCKDFDYSDSFLVECPHSTFCMKKVTSGHISTSTINAVERNCAEQKRKDMDLSPNGTWVYKDVVEEAYTEGCTKTDDKGARTPTILNCYCKGDYCNASPKTFHAQYSATLISVILFLFVYFNGFTIL